LKKGGTRSREVRSFWDKEYSIRDWLSARASPGGPPTGGCKMIDLSGESTGSREKSRGKSKEDAQLCNVCSAGLSAFGRMREKKKGREARKKSRKQKRRK